MQARKHHLYRSVFLFALTIAISACGGPKQGNRQIKVNIEVVSRGDLACPVPSGITSLPLEANVGATIALEGFVTSNHSASYAWSGTGGVFSTQRTRTTMFTCAYAGDHTVTFTIAKAGCTDSSMSAIVTCTVSSASGAAGVGPNGGVGG